jgi:hypothetical protein
MAIPLAAAAAALAGAAWLRLVPVSGPRIMGMAPYDGEPVAVVIRNMSPANHLMSADILVAPRPDGR